MTAVHRYFVHMNAGQYDQLARQFTEGAEVTVPGTGTVIGREAIEALYNRIFAPWVEHHDEPVRIVDAGGTVTVDVRFTGALANGHRASFDAVDVFDLDAETGLISRLTNWYDSHAVRQELTRGGAAEPEELEPLRHRVNALGICAALGIECTELHTGRARLTMVAADAVRHRTRAVPGALLVAFADVAASFALHTVVRPEDLHVTTDLTTHFVAPAIEGPFHADGRVVRAARRHAHAAASVTDAQGAVCAEAMGGGRSHPTPLTRSRAVSLVR